MILQLHTLTADQLDALQVAIDAQRNAGVGTPTDPINCAPSTFTLSDLLTSINAINERAKANGQALVGKAFKEFFDRCPEVRAVIWTQYAPYFNDGDPCVFSVHDPEVRPYSDQVEPELAARFSEDADEDEDENGYGYGERCMLPSKYRSEEATPSQARVRAAWDDLLASLFNGNDATDKIMQWAFGDDCKVVATREGFDIGEWSHD